MELAQAEAKRVEGLIEVLILIRLLSHLLDSYHGLRFIIDRSIMLYDTKLGQKSF